MVFFNQRCFHRNQVKLKYYLVTSDLTDFGNFWVYKSILNFVGGDSNEKSDI